MRIVRRYMLFNIVALSVLFGGSTYARNYNNVHNISVEIEQLLPSTEFTYKILNNAILIISLAKYESSDENSGNKKKIADIIAKIARKHLHNSTITMIGVVYKVRKNFFYFLCYEYSDVTYFFKVN